ncbi:MAG TPA: hypothetical protein VE079_12760 [Ensifer sp.]|nr:hypothetical protein [Ensifer sp.]
MAFNAIDDVSKTKSVEQSVDKPIVPHINRSQKIARERVSFSNFS